MNGRQGGLEERQRLFGFHAPLSRGIKPSKSSFIYPDYSSGAYLVKQSVDCQLNVTFFQFSFLFCFPRSTMGAGGIGVLLSSLLLSWIASSTMFQKMTRQAQFNVLFQDKITRVKEAENKKQEM